MDAQLTLTSKQRLIDIFAELYSQEDIFAIGRLVGIDKNQYYGFGMNGVQLAEAFINVVVQKEKVQLMFEIMDEKKEYYRSALNEFIPYSEVNEKNLKNGLKAIVIGINEYDFGGGVNNLKCAAADAEALILFLRQKWKVDESDILKFTHTANYSEIMSKVKEMCESLTENNNLLFFFSGHGCEKDGHSYLITTDTDFDSQGNILNAISLEELNSIIKKSKANLKIRFFDACHCGESFSKDIILTKKLSATMKKDFLATGSGWITFCSCDIDECSNEIYKLHHGAFTYYLIEGLNGAARRGNGKIHIEDLKIYICDKVPNLPELNGSQNPQYQCEIEGNILVE